MILAISMIIIFARTGNVQAQLKDLFYDHFAYQAVDPQIWYYPSHSNVMGRTIYRVSYLPASSYNEADIVAESYTKEGSYFLGTDVATKSSFNISDGKLIFTVRARMYNPAPRGIVGMIFLQGVSGNSDEQITFEFQTNDLSLVHTGIFTKARPDDGLPIAYDLSSLANTYHTYVIEISSSEVIWKVDDVEIRRSYDVPTGPVQLHFSMWVPASDWLSAYDAGLQPTNVLVNNQKGTFLIDYALVQSEGIVTSVTDVETPDKINIYPNPAHDRINFSDPQDVKDVSIYTMTGNKVIDEKEVTSSLSLAGLPSGLYTVKIKIDGGYYFRKLIIE
jgi:beta-glucanase (GH16 family)